MDTITYCQQSKGYCSLDVLRDLGLGSKFRDPDAFIQDLVKKHRIFSPVALPPEAFQSNGESLTNEGTITLLSSVLNDDQELAQSLRVDPNSFGHCHIAKPLGEGGAQTLQLFAIQETCRGPKPVTRFIFKEMAKAKEEASNIAKIKNSFLNIMDMNNTARPPELPAMAFDITNVLYDGRSKSHRMALLNLAPGKSFFNLTRDFVDTYEKYQDGQISEDQYSAAKREIEISFFRLGKALGSMHLYFKPRGVPLLTKTHALHGDLHLHNVFVDPTKNFAITLIDTETMSASIDTPQSIVDDLNKVYLYATLHRLSKQKARRGLPSDIWHKVMFWYFITGYAYAHTDRGVDLELVKEALLKIYSSRMLRNFMTILRADPVTLLKYQDLYVRPMIKAIPYRPPLPQRPSANETQQRISTPTPRPTQQIQMRPVRPISQPPQRPVRPKLPPPTQKPGYPQTPSDRRGNYIQHHYGGQQVIPTNIPLPQRQY